MHSEPGSSVRSERRFRRPQQLIEQALSAKIAPKLIILLGVLLTSPSLTLGLTVDEYFQRVSLQQPPVLDGAQREPWKLFTFADGPKMNHALMEEGMFPWWSEPELVISFFRPLASLSLWVDHTFWPDDTALMRLHSMLWLALLLGAVSLLYRDLCGSTRLATLALFLYAVDDARAFLVGWISLRNAPMALAPAFLALLAHHRFRSGRGAYYGWLAPACLALGLACGEVALAVCGYLFAYAVFLDRGTLRQRALSLLPYAAMLLPYRILYNVLGFGGKYSGSYLDPVREPLMFARGLLTRVPVLLFSQFATLPSDLWEGYPLMAPWVPAVVFTCMLLGLGALWFLFRPLLRSSPVARFWALGCVLSTFPVCGTYPQDRLLTATSLGGAALLASVLLALRDKLYPNPTRWTRALGTALIVMNAIIAPVILSVRAQDIDVVDAVFEYADRSFSRGPDIARKTIVMLNPPFNALGLFFPVLRAAKGVTLPGGFRYLATGESELQVERLDAHTLRLVPEGGFLSTAAQRLFRAASRPFRAGDAVELSDVRFDVPSVTPDGRPTEVVVRFQKPLDDPSFQWVRWENHGYVPFELPPIGGSTRLPKFNLFSLALGPPR